MNARVLSCGLAGISEAIAWKWISPAAFPPTKRWGTGQGGFRIPGTGARSHKNSGFSAF